MWNKILLGVLSGFLSAVLVDINAWKNSPPANFDWKLAIGRWIAGALAGAGVGSGFSVGGE